MALLLIINVAEPWYTELRDFHAEVTHIDAGSSLQAYLQLGLTTRKRSLGGWLSPERLASNEPTSGASITPAFLPGLVFHTCRTKAAP